jgi:hypothetical protein
MPVSYDVEAAYDLADWSGGEDRPPWANELRLACDEIVRLRRLIEELSEKKT